jgi:hypothetical protein
VLDFLLTRSKFYRELNKAAERNDLESFLKGQAVETLDITAEDRLEKANTIPANSSA